MVDDFTALIVVPIMALGPIIAPTLVMYGKQKLGVTMAWIYLFAGIIVSIFYLIQYQLTNDSTLIGVLAFTAIIPIPLSLVTLIKIRKKVQAK